MTERLTNGQVPVSRFVIQFINCPEGGQIDGATKDDLGFWIWFQVSFIGLQTFGKMNISVEWDPRLV